MLIFAIIVGTGAGVFAIYRKVEQLEERLNGASDDSTPSPVKESAQPVKV